METFLFPQDVGRDALSRPPPPFLRPPTPTPQKKIEKDVQFRFFFSILSRFGNGEYIFQGEQGKKVIALRRLRFMLEHLDRASCVGAWQKQLAFIIFPYFFVTAKSIFIRKRNDPVYEDSLPPCGYKFIFRKKRKGAFPGFPHFIFGLKWEREYFFESLLLKVREIVVILGKIISQNFPPSGVVRPTVLRGIRIFYLLSCLFCFTQVKYDGRKEKRENKKE